jgi:hypothetical protein
MLFPTFSPLLFENADPSFHINVDQGKVKPLRTDRTNYYINNSFSTIIQKYVDRSPSYTGESVSFTGVITGEVSQLLITVTKFPRKSI